MNTSVALALMAVLLAAGFILGYQVAAHANTPHQQPHPQANPPTKEGQAVSLTLRVKEKPRLITVNLPGVGEETDWATNIQVLVTPKNLDHPVAVRDVEVYVKTLQFNETVWRRASHVTVIGGVNCDCTGDKLVVPGETAKIEVFLTTPKDEKPLEIVVAVKLEGLGTLYSQPLQLPVTP